LSRPYTQCGPDNGAKVIDRQSNKWEFNKVNKFSTRVQAATLLDPLTKTKMKGSWMNKTRRTKHK